MWSTTRWTVAACFVGGERMRFVDGVLGYSVAAGLPDPICRTAFDDAKIALGTVYLFTFALQAVARQPSSLSTRQRGYRSRKYVR